MAQMIREDRTPEDLSDATLNELVARMAHQMSSLLRDEIRLAQTEMTAKARRAGMGAGLLGGTGVIGLYGAACVIAAIVLALIGPLGTWQAALVVGGVLIVVAGLAALVGFALMKSASPPVPTQAVAGVKQDVEAIRPGGER